MAKKIIITNATYYIFCRMEEWACKNNMILFSEKKQFKPIDQGTKCQY